MRLQSQDGRISWGQCAYRLRRRMYAHRLAVLVAAGIAVAVAGCGSTSSSTQGKTGGGSSSERTTIRVGALKIPSALAYFVALDRGLFDQAGLNVKTTYLSGGPAIVTAIASHSLDTGYADVYSWGAALANGYNLQLATGANGVFHSDRFGSAESILVLKDSPYRSAKDLVGKKIAVNPSISTKLWVQKWLQQNGVDPKSVTIVDVPFPSMFEALTAGHVQAIFDTDPFSVAAKANGAIAIGEPFDAFPADVPFSGFYFDPKFVGDHRDAVDAFVHAYWQASKIANGMSKTAKARLFAKYAGVDLISESAKIPGLVQKTHWWPFTDGPIDVAATNKVINEMSQYGLMDKTVDISSDVLSDAR